MVEIQTPQSDPPDSQQARRPTGSPIELTKEQRAELRTGTAIKNMINTEGWIAVGVIHSRRDHSQ